MKLLIVAAAVLGVSLAFPQQQGPTTPAAVILNQDSELNVDGSHRNSFETSDGTIVSVQGTQKQLGPDDQGEAVQGGIKWRDELGNQHQLVYSADENGYQVQGDTVPQIPEAIKRGLEWNAAHPEEDSLV